MLDTIKHITDDTMIITIVILGSIAHSTSLIIISRKSKELFTFVDWVANTVVAGFSGIMFSFGADYITDSEQLIYFITGAGAFAGLVGINTVTEKMLGIITDLIKIRMSATNQKD